MSYTHRNNTVGPGRDVYHCSGVTSWHRDRSSDQGEDAILLTLNSYNTWFNIGITIPTSCHISCIKFGVLRCGLFYQCWINISWPITCHDVTLQKKVCTSDNDIPIINIATKHYQIIIPTILIIPFLSNQSTINNKTNSYSSYSLLPLFPSHLGLTT